MVGWIRYKPLLPYITQQECYEVMNSDLLLAYDRIS